MVSYKYEVDQMKTIIEISDRTAKEKSTSLDQIALREREIEHQQRLTKGLFIFFFVALIVLVFFIRRKSKSAITNARS